MLLIGVFALAMSAGAYKNPLFFQSDSPGAGVADPGVLRWMGKYYLYSTKVPENAGVRCWESEDLVNWKFMGFCTGDDPAFAQGHGWSPSPSYYNGKFYLYVCGIDQKHKVFESDKPTGPFVCVNKDFIDVNTLDAAPLLDDDGQLYVFYAGWEGVGIQYRTASSPTKADGPNQALKACQFSADNNGNFWTEGPDLWKRDGVYYLAYCGNDWLKDSYQVRIAKGRTIADLKPQKSDQLIAQKTGPWVAVGCNWIIRGPNLKSLWHVYHCRQSGGHARRMCLDRLYFDDSGDMRCDGPTWTVQHNPEPPLYFESFLRTDIGHNWMVESGKWRTHGEDRLVGTSGELVCKVPIKPNFVAEFNVKSLKSDSSGRYGIALVGESERASILIDPTKKTLELIGKTSIKAALPSHFDLGVWHTIIVQQHKGRLQVRFDEMTKIDTKLDIDAARISLIAGDCEAAFGWCGFCNYEAGEQAM